MLLLRLGFPEPIFGLHGPCFGDGENVLRGRGAWKPSYFIATKVILYPGTRDGYKIVYCLIHLWAQVEPLRKRVLRIYVLLFLSSDPRPSTNRRHNTVIVSNFACPANATIEHGINDTCKLDLIANLYLSPSI